MSNVIEYTGNQMNQGNLALSIIESMDVNSISETMRKINEMQDLVKANLKEGFHYGVIPGTQKPTLYKSGAEAILMLFGITSEYELVEKIEDYKNGFFAYTVKCILTKNGSKITEGVGSCNTKENKYKNQDSYTLANTVLKMAKKRSQVDASLTVGSLSDVFTQDLEDIGQFTQSEQLDNMTSDDAANMKVTFGKHKGKLLGQIYREDKSYIDWLKENARDEVMKKACVTLENAVKEHKQNKATESEQMQNNVEKSEPLQQEQPMDDEGLPWDNK